MLFQMVDIFGLGIVVLLSIHPDILLPPQNQAGKGPEFDGIFFDDLERELQAARQEAHTITKGLSPGLSRCRVSTLSQLISSCCHFHITSRLIESRPVLSCLVSNRLPYTYSVIDSLLWQHVVYMY